MLTSPIKAQDRLIVALDLASIDDARSLVAELDGIVSFFKVGLVLQMAEGVGDFINGLIKQGKRVFLDYKYLDVEETMQKAVERAASIGVTFLSIHGNGSIIRAAVKGRGKSSLKILAVTVLTSMDAEDIKELGFNCSVETLVLHRAQNAIEGGCDGVIASGLEAQKIRELAKGRPLLIVTPGVRERYSVADDQKRVTEPGEAIRNGADYLVMGRPVYEGKPDPVTAANRIILEMQNAFDQVSEEIKDI